MAQSILVGDKISDIQAARTAGVGRAYFVTRDMEQTDRVQLADGIVHSLFECADRLGLAKHDLD